MNSDRMEANYLDFELRIDAGVGREFPVSVINSPAGEARETMHFPFDELALENRLQALQIALLRSGGKRRRVNLPEEQTVQDFGRDLCAALFCGEIRSRYDVSLIKAAHQGKGLRVKLRIQAPELAALPWEFIFDKNDSEYLCLSRETPIVRYIELPKPIQPLTITLPLRILVMIAAPSDLQSLDIEKEKKRIEEAVKDLETRGLVELTWLSGQTWRDLQRAMRGGPWHVFHFIGHGGFDTFKDEGLICLSNEEGKTHPLSATQLGRLLAGHKPLRLVLLNACEGARGGNRDIFSSTASILVQRGIPAVIAMQYEITDRAAVEFSRTFYEVLTEGFPIDASVAEARISISLAINNTLEWGTPVLYMRSPDGILFSLEREPEVKKKPSKIPPAMKPEKETSLPLAASVTKEKTEDIPAEVQSVKQQAKKVYKNDKGFWEAEFDYDIKMVYIPAGEFTMGSNDGRKNEKPVHPVTLDGYWIGKYEVTVGQFREFVDEKGYRTEAEKGDGAYVYSKDEWQKKKDANWRNPYFTQGDNNPVVCVSWNDAHAYNKWLSEKTGLTFKLPTEAQWEKAARGKYGRKYPWGNKFDKSRCNSWESGLERTSLVGSYPIGVSPFGLMDVAGNVWEWCSDWYADDYYKKSPGENPTGPKSGSVRVFRGGSWKFVSGYIRCAFRGRYGPAARDVVLGFRLCEELTTK